MGRNKYLEDKCKEVDEQGIMERAYKVVKIWLYQMSGSCTEQRELEEPILNSWCNMDHKEKKINTLSLIH